MTNTITKTDTEWKALLAEKGAEPRAFEVTRQAATERPFTGKYADNYKNGTYVCICCDTPLFKSDTKFDVLRLAQLRQGHCRWRRTDPR